MTKTESQPLQWSELLHLLEDDNVDGIEIELARRGNDLDLVHQASKTLNFETIFHAVIKKKSLNCLIFLLGKVNSKTDVSLDTPDVDGRTPLHLAVKLSDRDNSLLPVVMLKALISGGAFLGTRDDMGNSPLHDLSNLCRNVKLNHIDTLLGKVTAILSHGKVVDLSIKNAAGFTVNEKLQSLNISSESKKKNLNMFARNYFLKYQEDNISKGLQKDSIRTRVTNYITERKYNKLITLVQEEFSSENNLEDMIQNWYIGSKPLLYYIVKYLDINSVNQVLINGFDPWVLCRNDGKLSLHVALDRGHHAVVEALLKCMKDTGVNMDRIRSYSLLQTVICNSTNGSKHDSGVNHFKCLKLLLSSDYLSVDVNQRRSFLDNNTPLDLAKKSGNKKAENLLIEKGATSSSFIGVEGDISNFNAKY